MTTTPPDPGPRAGHAAGRRRRAAAGRRGRPRRRRAGPVPHLRRGGHRRPRRGRRSRRELGGGRSPPGGDALRLVYGGVFDRHPGASLVLGHTGELLPFQAARLDSRNEQVAASARPRLLLSEYLRRNVYATTSGLFSHPALQAAVELLGADHVMFAIDHPYERSSEAVEFLRSAPLPEADLAAVAHGNADRVFRLDGPVG